MFNRVRSFVVLAAVSGCVGLSGCGGDDAPSTTSPAGEAPNSLAQAGGDAGRTSSAPSSTTTPKSPVAGTKVLATASGSFVGATAETFVVSDATKKTLTGHAVSDGHRTWTVPKRLPKAPDGWSLTDDPCTDEWIADTIVVRCRVERGETELDDPEEASAVGALRAKDGTMIGKPMLAKKTGQVQFSKGVDFAVYRGYSKDQNTVVDNDSRLVYIESGQAPKEVKGFEDDTSAPERVGVTSEGGVFRERGDDEFGTYFRQASSKVVWGQIKTSGDERTSSLMSLPDLKPLKKGIEPEGALVENCSDSARFGCVGGNVVDLKDAEVRTVDKATAVLGIDAKGGVLAQGGDKNAVYLTSIEGGEPKVLKSPSGSTLTDPDDVRLVGQDKLLVTGKTGNDLLLVTRPA